VALERLAKNPRGLEGRVRAREVPARREMQGERAVGTNLQTISRRRAGRYRRKGPGLVLSRAWARERSRTADQFSASPRSRS
jgi:hypothetical protein